MGEIQDNRGSVRYSTPYIYNFDDAARKKIIKAKGWRGEVQHITSEENS